MVCLIFFGLLRTCFVVIFYPFLVFFFLHHPRYGSQESVQFLYALASRGAFWSPHLQDYVRVRRLLILGACNPPSHAGRQAIPDNFLHQAGGTKRIDNRYFDAKSHLID